MTIHVALLRGVNVAGHGILRMSALRAAFQALGYADVRSYIQSGNIVFASDALVHDAALGRALSTVLGMDVTGMTRTSAELRRIVDANPFSGADTSRLYVAFLADRPPATVVAALDLVPFQPDEAVIVGTEAYLHLPGGAGRAKLPLYLDRRLGVPMTVRNWNTVGKLVELTGA